MGAFNAETLGASDAATLGAFDAVTLGAFDAGTLGAGSEAAFGAVGKDGEFDAIPLEDGLLCCFSWERRNVGRREGFRQEGHTQFDRLAAAASLKPAHLAWAQISHLSH